ncbi:SUMO-activating enzyme subunit 1B [Trifolium medium]|uniref:SUMO-activating enzyme subunit 1B n=1 Tax=Trifolium medium TaxID=97028 RepID=A0A392NRW7_9FABA|nr:SUMO-activating enzyme subunit 1B [Trifolium medium]
MQLGMGGGGKEVLMAHGLYDRKIRVWREDAQRRLNKAHVLVNGMKGNNS